MESNQRLADVAPELERIFKRVGDTVAAYGVSEIQCETVLVAMRDGVCLATDVYLPPQRPAPAIVMRTPYGRADDRFVGTLLSFARRGYAVVSQDCRGTGDSEPEAFEYYVYESQDGFDVVDWIARQSWFGGFIGACGSSYVGQTQWCMATHPRMSTIVPEVSGLGIAPVSTAQLYMYLNASARSVGKGAGKVRVHHTEMERLFERETMAGGYFNEPLDQPFSESLLVRYPVLRTLPPSQARHWLWRQYCMLDSAGRAEFIKVATGAANVTSVVLESMKGVFGHQISLDAHTLPRAERSALARSLCAPALMITGWYDWGLNDALATWELLRREARDVVRSRSRLIITPSAHNMPGYREGSETHPELQHNHRLANNASLLLHWYATVREGTTGSWPNVIYYLMGANEWRVAPDWPPPDARPLVLYFDNGGILTPQAPQRGIPDRYTYDPRDPTPTVGGSVLSYVYPPGSVDVSDVQRRVDVVTYTTAPLECHTDVVGPVRVILYASSTATDTDFSARLSDVFPDGRAIQLQSGILRARYRKPDGDPELLDPGRIYRMEIDLWATANRFMKGHRLRVDISSADFPHFDRNSNRGGQPGDPMPAQQSIYHDAEHPSQVLLSVLGTEFRCKWSRL